MSFCPNKSHPDYLELASKIGEDNTMLEYIKNGFEIPEPSDVLSNYLEVIQATPKLLKVLTEEKVISLFNRFFKNNKDKFYKELTALVGSQQVELLQNIITKNNITSYEELLIQANADLTQTITIKTAKETKRYQAPDDSDEIYTEVEQNSQHYSNLTVPGGTNYTENEIATPDQTIPKIANKQITSEQFKNIEDLKSIAPEYNQFSNEDIQYTIEQLIPDSKVNINESEITYTDEDGNPCVKMGLKSGKFTKGGKWEIIKEFKGASHERGGIDIEIGNRGIKMSGKQGKFEAKFGLVINKKSLKQ